MTEIKPPFGPLIFLYIYWQRNGSITLLLVLCYSFAVIKVQGLSNFIDFLRFHRNFALLIRFEPLRGPLIRKQTVFILLLVWYNADMALQNNFDVILTCKRALTFFPNNFLIFAPPPLRP